MGNVVDLWEKLADEGIKVDLGSDQTSLHNPFAGGYYPAGYSFEESNRMMSEEPEKFKEAVYASLRRQVAAIKRLTAEGMYFFDYGNAFLLESSRAGADILKEDGSFIYPSYVEDIMGTYVFRLRLRAFQMGVHERRPCRPCRKRQARHGGAAQGIRIRP